MNRLAARGPIIHWSATTAAAGATGVTASRDDWAAGRSLAAEERRCGMLTTVAEAAAAAATVAIPAAVASSRAVARRAPPRLRCVAKAQASDWQLNEIDADGFCVFLRGGGLDGGDSLGPLRARWRKTRRHATRMIEVDGDEPFGEPGKAFDAKTVHLGVYQPTADGSGGASSSAPLLTFATYAEGHALESVRRRLRYAAAVPSDAVHFSAAASAGGLALADAFGCVTHRGVAVGVPAAALPHASKLFGLRPLIFEPGASHAMAALGDLSREPRGVFVRILLRCVDPSDVREQQQQPEAAIMAALQALARDGFANYFDVARFGIGANASFELAGRAAAGDTDAAAGMWLQALAERSPTHHMHFLRYLSASTPTTTTTTTSANSTSAEASLAAARRSLAAEWLRDATKQRADAHELRVLRELAKGEDQRSDIGKRVWACVPNRVALYASAAEFVWNALASQRLLTHGPRVVAGDVVRVRRQGTNKSSSDVITSPLRDEAAAVAADWEYRVVSSAEAADGAFDITQVVLPVPYPRLAAPPLAAAVLVPETAGGQRALSAFAAMHGVGFLADFGGSPLPAELAELLRRGGSGVTRAAARARCGLPAVVAAANAETSSDDPVVYRPLIVRPEHLEAAVLRDPNAFAALKSDAFALQERLPLRMALDRDARLRAPCEFNVSERFREKMAPVLAASRLKQQRLSIGGGGGGDFYSVAVACRLPRGSHPLVMLRERFDVAHASFHDLLTVA